MNAKAQQCFDETVRLITRYTTANALPDAIDMLEQIRTLFEAAYQFGMAEGMRTEIERQEKAES